MLSYDYLYKKCKMKRTIRLNESQLCNMISEAVKRALREEGEESAEDIRNRLADEYLAATRRGASDEELDSILDRAPKYSPEESRKLWDDFAMHFFGTTPDNVPRLSPEESETLFRQLEDIANRPTSQPTPPIPEAKTWRKKGPCSI